MATRGMNQQMRSIFKAAGKNEFGPLKTNTLYTAKAASSDETFIVGRFREKGAKQWSWRAVGADGTEFVAGDLPSAAVALGYVLSDAAPVRKRVSQKRKVVFVRPEATP